jgi:hypothetical protein
MIGDWRNCLEGYRLQPLRYNTAFRILSLLLVPHCEAPVTAKICSCRKDGREMCGPPYEYHNMIRHRYTDLPASQKCRIFVFARRERRLGPLRVPPRGPTAQLALPSQVLFGRLHLHGTDTTRYIRPDLLEAILELRQACLLCRKYVRTMMGERLQRHDVSGSTLAQLPGKLLLVASAASFGSILVTCRLA